MADQTIKGSGLTAPLVAPKKVKPGRTSTPPGRAVESGQDLSPDTTIQYRNSVDTYLSQNKIAEAVRMAVRQMGTVGTAHFNLIEVAMSGWDATAYNRQTSDIDEAGQAVLNALLQRLDQIQDYSVGYDDKVGVERSLEQMINDVIVSGGMGMELVLDKGRLPERIVLFPYDTITWRQGSQYRYPVQRGTGDEVELNYPTVFVSDFHRFVNEVYAYPMWESALREGRAYEQFLQDMRRVIARAGHGRLVITLDTARIAEVAPDEVKADPERMQAWMEAIRADVEEVASNMTPEDAFVTFDTAKTEILGGEGQKDDYVALMNAMSGNLATALKSNPSILGLRIQGSQSLSNTESLIFMRVAQAVRRPPEEAMSRMLTLGCALMGADVYVEFKFRPINLRPEDELAAFKVMKLDYTTKLLSLGFISDLEFSTIMGLGTLPDTHVPLSGTQFYTAAGGAIDASKASPNNGAQEKALQPDTPSNSGGESQ